MRSSDSERSSGFSTSHGRAGQPGPLEVARGEERRRPGLVDTPAPARMLADQAALLLVAVSPPPARHARRQGPLDAAVAVEAGDLLDHVDLALAVGPPGRDGDRLDARLRPGSVAKPIGASSRRRRRR